MATVERPPFSMEEEWHQGFSIDLMRELAQVLDSSVTFQTADTFPQMLEQVQSGQVDGAIANISITAAREEVMDFTLPIFESGLQIMVSGERQPALWRQILTLEIAGYLLVAVGVLFATGMLMWIFERRAQPYFDRPPGEALFPSFWWALNLVVNGGFEERMPRSPFGRVLAVIMVVSSLFIVSIFVARITAAMTVTALTSTVSTINDLDNRSVGTVAQSTAAKFLDTREVRYIPYPGFSEMITAFERGDTDAIVFDSPLLQYYLNRQRQMDAYLVDRIFRSEDYGIALPTGSPLREPLNQAILKLRENGRYDMLVAKWFGES